MPPSGGLEQYEFAVRGEGFSAFNAFRTPESECSCGFRPLNNEGFRVKQREI